MTPVVLSAAKDLRVVLSAAKDLLVPLAIAAALTLPAHAHAQVQPPALPMPVTNNAVAALPRGPGAGLYSLLGIDSTKRWSGITRRAFHLPAGARAWRELPPVPGTVGRLAAIAFAVRGKVYLIGGYTVDSAGAERSLPNVDIWNPGRRTWQSGAPTPVAVDDAVGGVWRDSIIVLVSGWHDTDNVADVQLYDVVNDRWMRGTPFPGVPVFGGSGAVSGDHVLVMDGARRAPGPVTYVLASQSWLGRIDPRDPTRITWDTVSAHPGPARYRAAAAGCAGAFVVAGGTDNPYNYNGVGYDKRPAAPLREVLTLDVVRRAWRSDSSAPVATMDHRGLVAWRGSWWIVGGMRASQTVSAGVARWPAACR